MLKTKQRLRRITHDTLLPIEEGSGVVAQLVPWALVELGLHDAPQVLH